MRTVRSRPSVDERFPDKYHKFLGGMAGGCGPLLESVKTENGLQIIDIADEMDKYDLLSGIFHCETMRVERDDSIVIVRNENKRYFGDNTVCYRCGETGHVSRACQRAVERNCMFCDRSHAGRPCDYLFCYGCHNFGHKEDHCRERRAARVICKACPSQLHYERDCPRQWRSYVIVSTGTSPEFRMNCAYCHSTGHFIDDCKMKDCQISIFTKAYKGYLKKAPKKKKR